MSRRRVDPRLARDAALRSAKARFVEIFPRAFRDRTYLAWERDYKWAAHTEWQRTLARPTYEQLLADGAHGEVASRISDFYARSHLNMLALFEWMAMREALADETGARVIAVGLFDLLYGDGDYGARLERFTAALDTVPQRQTRLAKWPVVSLFPFVAQPKEHLILKPRLVKRVAERFGWELHYQSRPNALTYASFRALASWLRRELALWKPRDLIDVQSFIWAVASDEYEEWPWE